MPQLIKKKSKKTSIFSSDSNNIVESKRPTKITIIDYNDSQFQEKDVTTVEDCFPFKDSETITWINIDGIHDSALIEKIGKVYGFHHLVLEDIANTTQRPKCEDLEDYIFIVLKMLTFDQETMKIEIEQLSLIFGSNYVISFQEKEGDIFDAIRERIRNAKGRIRKMGPAYLAYALIDTIVDDYFAILEKFGDTIEHVENELVTNPVSSTLKTIYTLKSDIIFLRRAVWPLRELISTLQRQESDLIPQTTRIYFRDVYDHTIQVIDALETFRDMTSGMLEIYLSSVSNKLNEIMKMLTMFTAIFIPLTLVSGIYGMNFKHMPELEWRYGYFFVLGIMAVIAVVLIFYFRRKKWL